jgi:hypothetical protein
MIPDIWDILSQLSKTHVQVNNTMHELLYLPFVFFFLISHTHASKDTRNNRATIDIIAIAGFLCLLRKPLDLDFLIYLAEGRKKTMILKSEKERNEKFMKLQGSEEGYLTQSHPHEHLDPTLHLYTLKCPLIHHTMPSNRFPSHQYSS